MARHRNDHSNCSGETAKVMPGDDFLIWAMLDSEKYREKHRELLEKKAADRSRINRANGAKKRKNNLKRKSPKVDKLEQEEMDRLCRETGHDYKFYNEIAIGYFNR